MRHIIESQQFSPAFIQKIFSSADRLEKKPDHSLRSKILASLFYEPSTRTRFSFESAMLRLGGEVISTENAKEFSSAAKGETLEDSIRVVSRYVDVIALRHFEIGAAKRASTVSSVPVINAGDGAGQHPTQALLDLYTIKRELGRINSMTVAMVGDLKHGRTVRSLSYLLGKYQNIKIIFISPKELKIDNDIKIYLKKHETFFRETEDLTASIPEIDVLYQTRVQRERFKNEDEAKKFTGRYQLTPLTIKNMKKSAIIMHPLPRVTEISPEIDHDPRAKYFDQAYYGLLIRMALLKYVCSED